jgi:hypothetical protein
MVVADHRHHPVIDVRKRPFDVLAATPHQPLPRGPPTRRRPVSSHAWATNAITAEQTLVTADI